VDQILRLAKGTLMAKMDIEQAYRNILAAPEDHPLFGFFKGWEHIY